MAYRGQGPGNLQGFAAANSRLHAQARQRSDAKVNDMQILSREQNVDCGKSTEKLEIQSTPCVSADRMVKVPQSRRFWHAAEHEYR